jgi:Ser/Thr protein kinase RdoA (MazF antagonist)
VLAELEQLVIHGSYGPGALSFRGDRLAGVAGYDLAAFDLRAVDLAQALAAFAGDGGPHRAGALDLECCAALVAAYREVEPVPERELAAVPLVLRARCLTGVLARTNGYFGGGAVTFRPEEDARRLVDAVEREADRVRWLEAADRELLSALGGSLVA